MHERVTEDVIVKELYSAKDLGVVEYILESDPPGQKWVVGIQGGIYQFESHREIQLFLLGMQAFGLCMASKKGLI